MEMNLADLVHDVFALKGYEPETWKKKKKNVSKIIIESTIYILRTTQMYEDTNDSIIINI